MALNSNNADKKLKITTTDTLVTTPSSSVFSILIVSLTLLVSEMPPKVARLVPVKKPEKKKEAESKSEDHKCVMCEASMTSKQALQDHFRLHANGTIDMKGKYLRPEDDPNSKQTPNKSDPPPIKNVPNQQSTSKISCDVCVESF